MFLIQNSQFENFNQLLGNQYLHSIKYILKINT